MIQFQCPGCHKKLSIKNDQAGSAVTCPACQESFELDLGDEDDPAADDYDVVDDEAAPPGKKKPTAGADEDTPRPRKKKKRKKKAAPGISPAILAAVGLFVLLAGGLTTFLVMKSGNSSPAGDGNQAQASNNPGGTNNKEPDFIDEDATPEERKFIEAGRPFVLAVAQNRLAEAHAMLSSHAKKSIFRGQFGGGEGKDDKAAMEEIKDVTPEQFAQHFERVVKKFGKPKKVGLLYVEETDPNILAGKVTEPLDRLSVAIAIGAMPASIPANIRKAALRAQIQTTLPAAPKLDPDDDEGPYFNVKYVLVEEDGKLKVGYFEFFPPSILD